MDDGEEYHIYLENHVVNEVAMENKNLEDRPSISYHNDIGQDVILDVLLKERKRSKNKIKNLEKQLSVKELVGISMTLTEYVRSLSNLIL